MTTMSANTNGQAQERSVMKVIHIYISEEDATAIERAAVDSRVSLSALVRGILAHGTKDFTDFTEAVGWADFRARGRPLTPISTGSASHDASWDYLKHNMAGPTAKLLDRIKALQEADPNLDVSEALEIILDNADSGAESAAFHNTAGQRAADARAGGEPNPELEAQATREYFEAVNQACHSRDEQPQPEARAEGSEVEREA